MWRERLQAGARQKEKNRLCLMKPPWPHRTSSISVLPGSGRLLDGAARTQPFWTLSLPGHRAQTAASPLHSRNHNHFQDFFIQANNQQVQDQ